MDGDDLRQELGMVGGPMLGKLLAGLLEAVIADPSRNSYDRLIAVAREIMTRLESKPQES